MRVVGKRLLFILMVLLAGCTLLPAQVKRVKIICLPKPQYSVTEIKLKVGENLIIEVSSQSNFWHNLVIVDPGKSKEVVKAALALGAEGMKRQWIPRKRHIVAHSKLLKNGESDSFRVFFNEPGVYPFLSTFPGQAEIMKGKIIVE